MTTGETIAEQAVDEGRPSRGGVDRNAAAAKLVRRIRVLIDAGEHALALQLHEEAREAVEVGKTRSPGRNEIAAER